MALVSPCRRICRYNGGTYCVGCKRHTDEIGRWFWMDDAEARAIMAELPGRRVSPAGELRTDGPTRRRTSDDQ